MTGERTPPAYPPSWSRSAVLVGRMPEQVFLREELGAARRGHGRLVLLGGEAGIGKTRLAQDLAEDARARDSFVLTGHCYDLTNTPPYGPWLDLVAAYRQDAALPAPPASFAGGTLARVRDQAALFAEVREFFATLAATRPMLLLLEDLHWADPASLELLRHIAPHLTRWPILLVGTYRVDELTRHNPFSRLIPALVREANGLRLDLKRLDAEALRELVRFHYELSCLDEAHLTTYLERHAEGNPLFAAEILRTVEETGLLTWSGEEWTLGELDRVVVPSLLRQVIDARVERLGDRVRQPLAIAAVIGQEVLLALWAEIAGLDDETLLEIVELAVEAHLLAAAGDGATVRFVHALTREALYEGVLPPRRRLWHRAVAEALMSSNRPDPDGVAYHLQQAGDPRAWEWLVLAADRAQRAYAWLTAAERLRAATELLADMPGNDRDRARLLNRVGRLLRFSDPQGAINALLEAAPLAAHLGDEILAAEIFFVRGVALCYLDRFGDGLAAIATATESLEALPLEMTRAFTPIEPWIADALPETAPLDLTGEAEAAAMLHRAGLHFRRSTHPFFLSAAGQSAAAAAISDAFIAAVEGAPGVRGGIRSTAAFAHAGLGISHAAMARPDESRQAFARARELFAEYDHHALVAFMWLMQLRDVACTFDASDPRERRHIATEAEAALARAGGALRPGVAPRLARLGSLILDGRWGEALGILADMPEPANAFLRREVTAASASLARDRGDPAAAWAQIGPRFPAGPATAPGDLIHQEGLALQRLAADLCLDTGDLPGAHAWLTAHDVWLAWSGSVLGQAAGRVAWARYHLLTGARARARAGALEALAFANDPSQPLVSLAAHRLLGEIEFAAAQCARAEWHLSAALDLAVLCDVPFERALTLLAQSHLLLETGQLERAAPLLAEIRQTCLSLGAAPTLRRIEALETRLPHLPPSEPYPAGLTHREVEVLRLLSQRHTDKEIAEALFLGPRTIQSHVAHILNKLGVANRREAATVAARRGLL